MKHTIILLLFSCALWGQTIIFTKDKKEIHLSKAYGLTLILKDGNKYKGVIDSVTPSIVMIRTKDKGYVTVDIPNIKAFKMHYHLWYFAWFASLIQWNKTFNLEGFNYKFKPAKNSH